MKLVNRSTFLSLPKGIVVSKSESACLGKPFIKGGTIHDNDGKAIDFFYTDLTCSNDDIDLCLTGKQPVSATVSARDGLFEEDEVYAVWSEDDVAALTTALSKAYNYNKLVYNKLTDSVMGEDNTPIYKLSEPLTFVGIGAISKIDENSPVDKSTRQSIIRDAYTMILTEMFNGAEDNIQDLAFAIHLDARYPADADEVCHPDKVAGAVVDIILDNVELDKLTSVSTPFNIIVEALEALEKMGLTDEEINSNLAGCVTLAKIRCGVAKRDKRLQELYALLNKATSFTVNGWTSGVYMIMDYEEVIAETRNFTNDENPAILNIHCPDRDKMDEDVAFDIDDFLAAKLTGNTFEIEGMHGTTITLTINTDRYVS